MATEYQAEKWETLTDKQLEAVDLVAQGYTSKEGAKILGIAPKTFDHRIKAVCEKLGCSTRTEAARIHRHFSDGRERTPYPPFPITEDQQIPANAGYRSNGEELRFADASTSFVEHAPWREDFQRLVSGSRPSNVSKSYRLLLMLGAALVLAGVAMLVVGVANGLEQLVMP